MSVEPGSLGVVGGVGGLAARRDDLADLADAYDDLGTAMRARARATLVAAGDGGLLASAVVSPATFAEAEAAVVAAAYGPDGALGAALVWEADALAVRAVAAALTTTDRLVAGALGDTSYRVGVVVGPVAAGAALLAAGAAAARPGVLPAVAPRLAAALDGTLTTSPGLVEPGVMLAAGTLAGLVGGPLAPLLGDPGTAGAAGALAATYGPEAPPVVTRRPDLDSPVAAPRDLADLLGGLRSTAALADGAPGSVAVDTLVAADGSRRHVVHLPGTDDMTTRPWTQDGDARDLGANLRLAAGRDTTYGAGVLEAMAAAGIRSDEPVLLTGHSQGGMQALALGAAAGSPEVPYDVRQVVTAGAPSGQVGRWDEAAGPDVDVLALEQRGDVVPLLDGTPPEDDPRRVTVLFDDAAPGEGVVERHALRHYAAGAAAADASEHPSLVAQRERLAAEGFLGAGSATRQVFTVARSRD